MSKFKEDPEMFEDGTCRLGEDYDDVWITCNDTKHKNIKEERNILQDIIDKATKYRSDIRIMPDDYTRGYLDDMDRLISFIKTLAKE